MQGVIFNLEVVVARNKIELLYNFWNGIIHVIVTAGPTEADLKVIKAKL